jgi:hypothetical protein
VRFSALSSQIIRCTQLYADMSTRYDMTTTYFYTHLLLVSGIDLYVSLVITASDHGIIAVENYGDGRSR